jgi:hypothetical protein
MLSDDTACPRSIPRCCPRHPRAAAGQPASRVRPSPLPICTRALTRGESAQSLRAARFLVFPRRATPDAGHSGPGDGKTEKWTSRVGRGAGAPGARGAKNERPIGRARGAAKKKWGAAWKFDDYTVRFEGLNPGHHDSTMPLLLQQTRSCNSVSNYIFKSFQSLYFYMISSSGAGHFHLG